MERRFILNYIILIALLLTGRMMLISQDGEDLGISRKDVKSLNSYWTYMHGATKESIDRLPARKSVPPFESYTISKDLGRDFRETQHILVRSSLSSIRVKLDETDLYVGQEFSRENRRIPLASAWNIVKIPANSEGKTLCIETISPYEKMSGIINEVYYSSHDGLISFISRRYMVRTVMSTILFFMGIFITSIPIFTEKNNNSGIMYIGIFSILISLWLFGESRTSQFYSKSQFFIGAISYIMLTLFPIPMLIYVRDYVIKKTKRIYSVLIMLFSINTALVLALQLLGVKDFFETVWIAQLLIMLSFAIGVATFSYEVRYLSNKDAIIFSRHFTLLMVFGSLEILMFGRNNYQSTGIFIIIGLMLFMTIQLVNYIKRILLLLKKSYRAELYERLALEDKLTGAKNRMAFENDIEELFKDTSRLKDLRVVFFDLNNLKKINDTYGHINGDFAIRKAYRCIESIFGEIGDCYRLGGDEYAVIVEQSDEKVYIEKKKALLECIRGEDNKLEFDLSIAIGSAVYDYKLDKDSGSLINRADKSMYRDKRRQKNVANL